jgi:hypothetical protein
MKSLQEFINRLPKELIDNIQEYNVNHRPLMNKVLQQLIKTNNNCRYCKILITNEHEDKCFGFYIYTWNRYKYIYCSSDCCEAGDNGILKARRKWLNRLNNL